MFPPSNIISTNIQQILQNVFKTLKQQHLTNKHITTAPVSLPILERGGETDEEIVD